MNRNSDGSNKWSPKTEAGGTEIKGGCSKEKKIWGGKEEGRKRRHAGPTLRDRAKARFPTPKKKTRKKF